MHKYKVETTLVHNVAGPSTEFTAKDDLQANDIGHKFCKSMKGISFSLYRLEKNRWRRII